MRHNMSWGNLLYLADSFWFWSYYTMIAWDKSTQVKDIEALLYSSQVAKTCFRKMSVFFFRGSKHGGNELGSCVSPFPTYYSQSNWDNWSFPKQRLLPLGFAEESPQNPITRSKIVRLRMNICRKAKPTKLIWQYLAPTGTMKRPFLTSKPSISVSFLP